MIFISGCARSGTSLTTQILRAHGCYLGKPNRVNSLYEHLDIREQIIKPYLRSIGADELGQQELPDTDNLPPLAGLRHRVEHFLGRGEPRANKDAKMTLVWPLFADAFPEAKWVLVRRDKQKIADSCDRTNFMFKRRGRGWIEWVEEHEKRFERMRRELTLLEVWPDRYIAEPELFKEATDFCGLDFDVVKVRAAIDINKWHKA